ncbi:hypothetical protein BJD49_gp028 [Acinetobacter phage vB_AbaM_phiAbaA1]|nr:hypothetical protein BJD49_gp028 [Acinetobacter phage vB_AbaM_phiAbaA1]AJK27262.1 hypothetical protein phiAbaA1_159 [Acinetobacter phage vB_AbaM_phiAbaA1]
MYNIVNDKGVVVKQISGYWDAKRQLEELNIQKGGKVEHKLVKVEK